MAGINRRLLVSGIPKMFGINLQSIIKSQQTISTDANFTGLTNTEAISTVNSNNCLVLFGCHNNTTVGNKEADRNFLNIQISDTQLTLTKTDTTAGSYVYTINVIEFENDAVISNQFTSTGSSSSNGYVDVTLSAVSASNIIIPSNLGCSTDNTNNYLLPSTYAEMTSSTNLRIGTSYSGSASTQTIRAQVLELKV